jgi:hypothetical protein
VLPFLAERRMIRQYEIELKRRTVGTTKIAPA